MGRSIRWQWRAGAPFTMAFALLIAGCGGEAADDDGGPDAQTSARTAERSAAEQVNSTGESQILTALQAASDYMQGQRYAQAEQILMRLIERAPSDPRGHEMLGQLQFMRATIAEQQGDLESAKRLREQAATSYDTAANRSDSAGLHHSAALVLLSAGKQEEALRHFAGASTIDPQNPQHPLFAAQIRLQRKEWDEADALLQRALELDQGEPYVHASLAILALERGRNDEALAHIATARGLSPRNLSLRVQEARVQRRTGNPQRSLELLVPLPAPERAQLGVSDEIAAAYRALGEPAKAAAQWQEAYGAAQNLAALVTAALSAAEAHLEEGDREEALHWLNMARSAGPLTKEQRDALDVLEVKVRGK